MTNEATGLLRFTSHSDEVLNAIKHNAQFSLAIIGVGLIGGSLGLALKDRLGEKVYITANARTAATMELAAKRKACDLATNDLKEAVGDADIVFLSTPVLQMVPMVEKLIPYLKQGAIVTDGGSTKAYIAEELRRILPPGVAYVAGHPMTGKEKSGVEAADKDLFVHHCYVVVKDTGAPEDAVNKIIDMAKTVGSSVTTIDLRKHDRCASLISHIPHVAASALVTLLDRSGDDLGDAMKLAAGGFKDTTRIASSNADMWSDILMTNREAVNNHLESLKGILDEVITAINEGNRDALHEFFAAAKRRRDVVIAETEKKFDL